MAQGSGSAQGPSGFVWLGGQTLSAASFCQAAPAEAVHPRSRSCRHDDQSDEEAENIA